MKPYTITKKDTEWIKQVAAIHERLPSGWIGDYEAEISGQEKWIKRIIEKTEQGECFCMVISEKDHIVSYIWAEADEEKGNTVQIMSLWTKEEHRGKGFASLLKKELEEWAKSRGNIETIQTTVHAGNCSMVMLNERLGYSTVYYKMEKQVK